jgi:signal transduction histidine kinase
MTRTMAAAPPRLLPSQTERAIAVARIVLGATGLFAIWLDPAEPIRFVAATYALHATYVLYSIAVAGVMWNRSSAGVLPMVTHLVDIAIFSIFQYLTLGPSSPFFTYFIFSLFCGALRWGWQGTLGTSVVVGVAYIAMGASMSRTLGPTEFELNRFIIRAVYLAVTAALLVYLGQHEIRLRTELGRLAHWPGTSGIDEDAGLSRVLKHAAGTIGAGRALAAWQDGGGPGIRTASWSESGLVVARHAPDAFDPMVPPDLRRAVILCTGKLDASTIAVASIDERTIECTGLPLHRGLLALLGGEGLASAPLRTERVSGRVFFSDIGAPTAESLLLTEVVARAVGESLDQLRVTQQLREVGAREQRIALARDLHDGVLQSLTGIRFELQAVASTRSKDTDAGRDRLLAIERALAIEQRELRLFIDDLRPQDAAGGDGALADRLHALRERVALEWKVPVTIRVTPEPFALSAELQQAVPLMAHEAIVNAVKHAQPTRISVDVQIDGPLLRLVVGDDGSGFSFRGRHAHQALVEMQLGPASLLERAAALGGEMSIESTAAGSKVEIAVPLDGRMRGSAATTSS